MPTKIEHIPFLKILPTVTAGILAANAVHFPLWAAVCATAAFIVSAVATSGSQHTSSALTYGAIFFFAVTMTYATRTRQVMPHGERLIMTMVITGEPQTSGRWTKADARISEYRIYGTNGASADWKSAGEKAVVRFDSSFNVRAGERLIATGYAGELGSEDYAGYVRLMERRGYSQTIWIGPGQDIISIPGTNSSPRRYALKMQSAAADRLATLHLAPEAAATAAAMTIGNRTGLSADLREDYSATGASHLLAVSGLHVGIVAMLVNILLYLLPGFRYGHIVKNIMAIAVIWLYATLTGLSPSAVRAAMMFTGAQLALAASRTGNSTNILLATATLMLLINPNYLYDISFQLSFAAVAGIFMLYRPLYGLVRSRYKAVNGFWAVFMIGLAATLATAPLVSHYFGRIPLIGIFVNPVLIFTANVTVLFSLIWIIMPLPFLNGIFSAVIGFSAGMQNDIISICAGKSWASIPLRLEMWQAVIVYAVIFAAFLLLRRAASAHSKPPLISDML